MRVRLDNRFLQKAAGKSIRASLAHPLLRAMRSDEGPVRIWVEGREIGRPAANLAAVVAGGDGLWFLDDEHLWMSFPPGADPWDDEPEIIVEIPTDEAQRPAPTGTPHPLMIAGPQRSGSTALMWGLDHATSYHPPKIALRPNLQCESYYLRQILDCFLEHPLTTPFGADCGSAGFATGLMARGGHGDSAFAEIGRHINNVYSTVTNTDGRWIDKSPGWECIPVAPLFAALYPHGKLLFLSRDPVSCVLSMARLDSRDVSSPKNPGALVTIGRLAAVWSFCHYMWRTYCRPLVPAERCLEMPFSQLKGEPAEALEAISRLLELPEDEAAALPEMMQQTPVRSHKSGTTEYDPVIKDIIRYLCRPEGRQWDYDDPPQRRSHRLAYPARVAYKRWLVNAMQSLHFTSEAIDRAKAWLTDFKLAQATPPQAGPPGPLLRRMLDTTPPAEEPPPAAPLVSTVDGADDEGASTARRAAGSTPMLSLIQVYTGTLLDDDFTGSFYEFATNKEFEWSARMIDRTDTRWRLDCVLNGHAGSADLSIYRNRVTGVYDNGARLDILEGTFEDQKLVFNRYVTE